MTNNNMDSVTAIKIKFERRESNEDIESNGNGIGDDDGDHYDCSNGDEKLLLNRSFPLFKPINEMPLADLKGVRMKRFNCLECGDIFIFKNCWISHKSRRSVHIEYPCKACNLRFTFYNRCALVKHIKKHLKTNGSFKIGKVFVSPLRLSEFLDSQQISPDDGNVGMQIKSEKNRTNGNIGRTKLSENEPSRRPSQDGIHSKDNLKNQKPLIYTINRAVNRLFETSPTISSESKMEIEPCAKDCSECGTKFDKLLEMERHFSLFDGKNGPFQCDSCSFMCPTKCSLSAHQKLHKDNGHVVCPECGLTFLESSKSVLRHILLQCYHFYRRLIYACPHCPCLIPSLNNFIEHLMKSHTLRLYKNPSNGEVFEHISTQLDESNYISVFQCPSCQTEHQTKPMYYKHLNKHLNENLYGKFIFSCPECRELSSSKIQLLNHMKMTHKWKEESSDDELTSQRIEDMCNRYHVDMKSTIATIVSEVANGVSSEQLLSCASCSYKASSSSDLLTHGFKDHISSKREFVCLLCANKTLDNKESLICHLSAVHCNRNTKCTAFGCEDNAFQTETDLLDHLIKKHFPVNSNFFANKGHSLKTKIINENLNPPLKRLKTSSSNHTPRRNGRVMNNKSNNANEMESKKRICVRCNFSASSQTEFESHIITHKTIKAPYLCYECGCCFVAAPSLKSHLLSEHRIENGDDYIKEKLPDLSPKLNDPEETPAEPTCSVCSLKFPDDCTLKQHVRVHGLAFIKSIQRQL